jgi:dTMP kinase
MFISFEGIDGSGKSTQIALLKNYLEQSGKKVLLVREPGGNDLSERIRNLLLDKSLSITPKAELLLFEAARTNLVQTIIRPALNSGTIVLADRFVDSTIAYQGYGRKLSLSDIHYLNHFATDGILPNITFYLQISIPLSISRMGDKPIDRMEANDIAFKQNVKEGFEALAKSNPERFVVIDGKQDIQQIHTDIVAAYNRYNAI